MPAGPERGSGRAVAASPRTGARVWDVDRIAVWTWIAVAVSLALAAACYPILFYVRRVWSFRQQAIFDTLSPEAKRLYLDLFHRSDAERGDTAAPDPTARFAAAYARWFGRGRLVVPATIVAALTLVYALLVSIAAAKWLMPTAMAGTTAVPLIASAAMTGAYILVSLDTISRVTRRDLLPDDLYVSALRLASCVPLGIAFASLANEESRPFVALAMTAFPLQETVGFLRKTASQRAGLEVATAATSNDVPSRLSGVDRAVCERLSTIGVNTIGQLAYSDPVQLTMRTSLGFVFALDLVSQALAWVYLEDKLNVLRPMGLRGSFEIAALQQEARDADPAIAANANALLDQLPAALGLTPEQTVNVVHQIADDPYTRFLLVAYS